MKDYNLMKLAIEKKFPSCEIQTYATSLSTHCILVNSSTVICGKSPFVILGVNSLFSRFISIFDGKSC